MKRSKVYRTREVSIKLGDPAEVVPLVAEGVAFSEGDGRREITFEFVFRIVPNTDRDLDGSWLWA